MDPIEALAREKSIAVVEDAAEAFATRHGGRRAGAIGDIGTFSFQATKTITTGEGGMVVTHDRRLFEKMVLFRSHGMGRKRYWHEVAGHNFRLTNLQAALGCAQFEKLDSITSERRRVHRSYQSRLGDTDGIVLQRFEDEVDPVLWAIAVLLEPKSYPQGRDWVIDKLMDEGIETRPGFYAASLMELYGRPELPICERIGREVVSLPTFPSLTDGAIDFICNKLVGLRS
jgi:perosamine synthetase